MTYKHICYSYLYPSRERERQRERERERERKGERESERQRERELPWLNGHSRWAFPVKFKESQNAKDTFNRPCMFFAIKRPREESPDIKLLVLNSRLPPLSNTPLSNKTHWGESSRDHPWRLKPILN